MEVEHLELEPVPLWDVSVQVVALPAIPQRWPPNDNFDGPQISLHPIVTPLSYFSPVTS